MLGLGTESSKELQPIEFSPDITNRYYTFLGDLEKRPGVSAYFDSSVDSTIWSLGGIKQISSLHEFINASGEEVFIGVNTSGISFFRSPGEDKWNFLGVFPKYKDTFVDDDRLIKSVMFNDSIIFVNGNMRPHYYNSELAGIVELTSTIIEGKVGSGSNATTLYDANVSDWINETDVAVNDVVDFRVPFSGDHFRVRSVITSVGTSSLDITTVGSSNATGIGSSSLFNLSNFIGSPYVIIDSVENNIIPEGTNSSTLFNDNVAVGGAATASKVVAVTGLDFLTTTIRIGDYIYNTTRNALTAVTTVSSNLAVTSVASQTAGDSFIFLKDALPIASNAHVHYGRLHLIDARDKTKIRVSGPNDFRDFTTFSQTLSSVTVDYGGRQPQKDELLAMDTFGRYLVVGGKNNLYATDGTNPIADVTADVIDLDPVGLFPGGIRSAQSLANNGREQYFVGKDGLRSFLAAYDSRNTTTNNKSESIKRQLVNSLDAVVSANDITLTHYEKKNWILLKVGDQIFNLNYTPIIKDGRSVVPYTITKFTGLIAEKPYSLVTQKGELLLTGGEPTEGSEPSVFYLKDKDVDKKLDNGSPIPTNYTSPWHTLQEGITDIDLIIKDGRYIKPLFESSGAIDYTISVVGDYNRSSSSTVTAHAIGGALVSSQTRIYENKLPMRWRGKRAQFTISTEASAAVDIINSYTIYGNVFGRR